jgi:hypothetical protein
MPSKAIGMGVCPRCGKPGTIVIKAGNYVYIKHGNTWHYIGTIDKVNLNKILIKNPENITTNKPKQKNKYTTIALITVATAIIILGIIILFTMYNKYMLGLGKDGSNSTKITVIYTYCNYKNFAVNNTIMVLCNKTIYNTTVISIDITKDNVTPYNFKS